MINPKATEGAGRGTPIGSKERDAFLEMREFMRRVGDYQESRNLNTAPAGRAGLAATAHRSTDVGPTTFHNTGSRPHVIRGSGLRDNGGRAPFSLISLSIPGTGSPKVVLNKGFVVEAIPSTAGPTGLTVHEVEYDGTALSSDPPPEIELSVGDYVYVEVLTDNYGNITDAPEVYISSSDLVSTHYQPPDEANTGGVTGDYFFKIGQLAGVGGTPKWLPAINSDIAFYHELWVGKTLAGAGLYKRRDPSTDVYEFKGLQDGYSTTVVPSSDYVKFDFNASNSGTGEDVYLSSGTDAAFRRIRGRGTADETGGLTKQIHVETNDGLLVRGNTVIGSNDYVSVVDGLVTEVKNPSTEPGYSRDWVLRDCDADPFADPPEPATILAVIRIVDGKITDINTAAYEEDITQTEVTTFVQSCHWIDDQAHSHS